MENKTLKKIIVIAIVFMITFSNCGFTLQALASSEGLSFMGFNLFRDKYLGFDAYFLDENGEEHQINYADVNDEMTLVVELEPKEEGYLKSGSIKAVAEEGDVNFEIKEVLVEEQVEESLTQVFAPDATLLKTEQVVNTAENTIAENTVDNNTVDNNTVNENTVNENTVAENVVETNTVSNSAQNETVQDTNTVVENTVDTNIVETNTVVEDTNTIETEETVEEQEELVDEEAVVNEKIEEEKEEVQVVKNEAEAWVVSSNEIAIKNIIEPTKLYIKLQFNPGEKLDVSSLYKKITVELIGKYIDIDLQEIDVTADADLELGWTYSKDIEVSGEYTKVSPFAIMDTKGTLIESKIVVKREIEDEKYLPVKQTKIEIKVPEVAGRKPVAMEVAANKLKATKGQDINEVVFTNENWTYNEETNTLTVAVENTDAVYTYGEDIYVVTYRYDSYVEENEIDLEINGKVTVEEFSGKQNNIIEKEINKTQKIIANVGELITYSIGTTEEKINKAKINANYNSAEAVYETEFVTTVNINVLTNDVLKAFTLKDTKEFYIDNQNLEFETQDVKYKKIKLKYEEISELLEKGGSIEIKSNSGELLYTLNKDLVKSQENCEIEIRGEVTGLEISFKDIAVNGNITVDFVKSIGKCSLDKSAFRNFERLESRIKAEVKYESEEEQGTELKAIKTEKYFENSYTSAEVTINRDSLSTIENNENVEIKIQLNNHLETSDLYVNPVFEIVFPEYVKNVEPKVTNLLYEEELQLVGTEVFVQDGIVKMRITLEGMQTKFSTGTLTNGTNIIVNTNIEVDDYTPRKEDQIKMYYYNEGVTNYESQTKWTVKTDIPTGILKTTNGFDVDVFAYQAPSGFILVNEIENYDGQNSKVGSIGQGIETREVAMEKEAQVATMNLIAMNNTGNECTDVTFLGRIPNKDATDVKTVESLGNNIDTVMKSAVVADEANAVAAKIYYSTNVNATKDLNDENNGWTETPEDLSQMKSFLIVPIEKVDAETVLKYSYNFEIPENLPYEAAMYGTFGAFYNNNSEVAVVSEIVTADKVGLVTKAGPKVEAVMSVDIGDGAVIGERRFLTYTLTVVNSGSVTAENITITNPIPEGTTLYEEKCADDVLKYGWFPTENQESLVWNIEKLEPSEVKTFAYVVKTPEKQSEEHYITNKATIEVPQLAIEVESNETKNKIKDSRFDMHVYSARQSVSLVGDVYELVAQVENISDETLYNVVFEYQLPDEIVFTEFDGTLGTQELNLENSEYRYNSENNLLTIQIPEWLTNEILDLNIVTEVIKCNSERVANTIKLTTQDGKEEKSFDANMIFYGPQLTAVQTSSATSTIMEGEYIEFITTITNNGNDEAMSTTIYTDLSENLVDPQVELSGASNGNLSTREGYIEYNQYMLEVGETLNVKVSGTAKEVDDDDSIISSKVMVINDYVQDIEVNEIIIQILNDSNKAPTEDESGEVEDDVTEDEGQEDNTQEDNVQDDNVQDDNVQDDTVEDEGQDNQEDNTTDNENVENNNGQDNNGQDDATQDESQNNQENNNNNNSNNESSSSNGNQSNDNSNNNNSSSNSNNEQEAKIEKYAISGKAWLDLNKNGNIDSDEAGISGVQVQLQNGNVMVKATSTSKDGIFKFEGLEPGNYTVIYNYDETLYTPTAYKATANREDISSSAREISSGKAVTDTIVITNSNIVNINLGLQNKDKANLTVHKYINSATVTTKKGETIHEYDSADLAKLEIHAKEVEGAVVELNYSIVIKNEGSIKTKAVQVIDYLPKDTTLVENSSSGWYLGTDGNAYNDGLRNTYIEPGETKTLNISLTRNMTGENTGVLSNKVEIKTETEEDVQEVVVDNTSTQETIISIKTGYAAQVSILIIIVTGAVAIVYLVVMRKIKIDLKNFRIKRIYK